MLSGILLDARRCNKRDDITGALVCRRDIYLQLLEGPSAAVNAAYARIERDDRHVNMTPLITAPVPARMFGDWEMLHDPVDSWVWSEEEIAAGVLDRATPEDIRGVFNALAERIRAQV